MQASELHLHEAIRLSRLRCTDAESISRTIMREIPGASEAWRADCPAHVSDHPSLE